MIINNLFFLLKKYLNTSLTLLIKLKIYNKYYINYISINSN